MKIIFVAWKLFLFISAYCKVEESEAYKAPHPTEP